MRALFTLFFLFFLIKLYGQQITISGTVQSEDMPLAGATVSIQGTRLSTSTDKAGHFKLSTTQTQGVLQVSYIGFEDKEVAFSQDQAFPISIQLKPSENTVDEVQIIGYGETTKRFNTGSVASISSKEIEQQPVTNVLSALSGRMPGVFVQTTNGLPGGNINIQIRGKSSLTAGGDPLYIIDGVPFPSSSLVANTALAGGLNGAIHPLNSINPSDIENITVLKDADATAIYGSRGANGVILITTKRGASGTTKVSVNSSVGFSKVSNFPNLLSLKDYLTIRREAFSNDGLMPSSDPTSNAYAPDLMVWDTTQYTDWAKYFMGNTAKASNTQLSISGGNDHTNFYVSANYRSETGVVLGDNLYQRGGGKISVNHISANDRFSLDASLSYTKDANKLVDPNMQGVILLPPNFPLYNENGSLNWVTNVNPVATLLSTTKSQSDNVIANTVISYKLLENLRVKLSAGANRLVLNQTMINPKSAQNPEYNAVSNARFGTNLRNAFIVEPLIEYSLNRSKSSFKVLLGGTWQNNIHESKVISARNFNNEHMLEDLSSAATISSTNAYSEYRYASIFGRATYGYANKYILNISGRRDGSSKFGPNNRFGNFGSIGAAWIISEEPWIDNRLSFISYTKLRVSYGITGNDQIADYQYLPTYSTSLYEYVGTVGLKPLRIANADFQWETNKKFELGVEVGLFDNQLLLSADWFNNKSGNQLVNYALPWLTGFNRYQANLPAKVRNRGWEIELTSRNIQRNNFSWNSSFNITVLRNKLLSFPNIENSSYANIYRVGESILREYGYRFAYVDTETGQAQYRLIDGQVSPAPAFENFFFTKGDRNPGFYGGLGNTFAYKNLHLEIFAQFCKQGMSGGSIPLGTLSNSFYWITDRWQSSGDITKVPQVSTYDDNNYYLSSANYHSATYLRIKNIALSLDIKSQWLSNSKINQLQAYIQGQNLLTFWDRSQPLYDPESGASINIPPLKSFVFGIQLTL